MVYLVGEEETAPVSVFGRLRHSLASDEGYKIVSTVVLGMRLRRVTIESPAGQDSVYRRNVARAAAALRRERDGRVIYSDAFRYKELFMREGFDEMDADALTAALAGRSASRAAGSGTTVAHDGTSAVLFSRHMNGDAWKTLQELCRRFRTVMAVTGADWSPALEALRRRTGVSVIEHPSTRQLTLAGVAVLYDAPPSGVNLPAGCVAVEARAGALDGSLVGRRVIGLSLGLPAGGEAGLPSGFPREPIFASVLSAGTLRPEDISILDITVSESLGRTLDKNSSIYYNECSYTTDN
jgi:hypothetical protein